MNIVYTSDDNYADIMGVSIASLLEANKAIDKINFYIINDGISKNNLDKLSELIAKYSRSVFYVTAPRIDDCVDVKTDRTNLSLTAFQRLFLPTMLSKDIGKILYLDCDTLIVDNLRSLYETNIDDCLAAGVLDPISIHEKSRVNLSADDSYFNSGVILFNLARMRKYNVEQIFLDYIRRHKGIIVHSDQGIINGTINNQIKVLSPRYNSLAFHFLYPYQTIKTLRNPAVYYSENEYKESVTNPAIIHFHGGIMNLRPWVNNSVHPYKSRWNNVKKMSPWKDTPPHSDDRSIILKLLVLAFKLLPPTLAATVGSFANRIRA